MQEKIPKKEVVEIHFWTAETLTRMGKKLKERNRREDKQVIRVWRDVGVLLLMWRRSNPFI
jgi:L-ascorbate metabolism protein UlaG (beta-lactamase superfamily)